MCRLHPRLGTLPRPANVLTQYKLPWLCENYTILFNFWNGAATSKPPPDLCRKFYGESSTDDILHKLLIARNVARQNNEDASDAARVQYDSKAVPHKFLPNQLVLLDEHSFLHKNQKLAPKWSGPHKIVRLKGDANAEILLRHNNRKTVVHTNRLKPYFVALSNSAFHPDDLPTLPQSANQSPQPASDHPPHDDIHTAQDDLLPAFLEVTNTVPSPSITPPAPQISPRRRARLSSSSSSATQPVTRRGASRYAHSLAHTIGSVHSLGPLQAAHFYATGRIRAAVYF